MTTISGALAAAKARLATVSNGVPLRYKGDQQTPLPDTPTAFGYVVFNNEGSGGSPIAFGGGRGNNLYRYRAFIEVYVFSPMDEGESVVLGYAETIAAHMRSFRDADISCYSADVVPVGEGSRLSPPGLVSEVNNYQCAIVEITMTFDQVG
jgi:hypothetical protein